MHGASGSEKLKGKGLMELDDRKQFMTTMDGGNADYEWNGNLPVAERLSL